MDVEPVETWDDLRSWMEKAPKRHERTDDGCCSCGWKWWPEDDWTWERHVERIPGFELRDYVASSTSAAGLGRVMTCGEESEWLYEVIDRLHATLDAYQDYMEGVATVDQAKARLRGVWGDTGWPLPEIASR